MASKYALKLKDTKKSVQEIVPTQAWAAHHHPLLPVSCKRRNCIEIPAILRTSATRGPTKGTNDITKAAMKRVRKPHQYSERRMRPLN